MGGGYSKVNPQFLPKRNLYVKQQRNTAGVCSWKLYCERTLGSRQEEKVEILNRFLSHRGNVLCHIVGLLPCLFSFCAPCLPHFCSILNKRFVFSKSAMESALWSLCLLTMTIFVLCYITVHCHIANSYIEQTEMATNSEHEIPQIKQ